MEPLDRGLPLYPPGRYGRLFVNESCIIVEISGNNLISRNLLRLSIYSTPLSLSLTLSPSLSLTLSPPLSLSLSLSQSLSLFSFSLPPPPPPSSLPLPPRLHLTHPLHAPHSPPARASLTLCKPPTHPPPLSSTPIYSTMCRRTLLDARLIYRTLH